MTITPLAVEGAFLLEDKVFIDTRGSFTEAWESNQFSKTGFGFTPSNSCFSFNSKSGTLRGLHYQREPYAQAKIVTCVSGSVYDVILDLRPGSASFAKWCSVELSAASGKSVFIPAGCAHGFITLTDQTVISYLIEGDYNATAAAGVRWNDPFFKISWPQSELIISPKDQSLADFRL